MWDFHGSSNQRNNQRGKSLIETIKIENKKVKI